MTRSFEPNWKENVYKFYLAKLKVLSAQFLKDHHSLQHDNFSGHVCKRSFHNSDFFICRVTFFIKKSAESYFIILKIIISKTC